jgi:nifR3 family TIM-barrel protein
MLLLGTMGFTFRVYSINSVSISSKENRVLQGMGEPAKAVSLEHNYSSSPGHVEVSRREPLVFGELKLKTRYLLSPLAGYTNLAFRRVIRGLGGLGLGTTDLVNARALMEKRPRTLEMIATTPDDTPLAVQIFGHDPVVMRDAAQFLFGSGVQSVDINMGCPVDRITNVGAGASMMCRPTATIDLVRAVVEAVPIPVTVKMRLGWDETQITAPGFAREFEQVGVAAIMIHGRTRAQGFKGQVSRAGIKQVVEAVEKIPVIGNGDIRTIEDAERMFRETGCRGISIGRGALTNPWIFRQLVEWEKTGHWEKYGSFSERMQLLIQQYGFLCENFSPEHALVHFRRTVHWYLKAMKVNSGLRHAVQIAKTDEEYKRAIQDILAVGPHGYDREQVLPEMHIPVPSGPIEHW